MKLSDDEFANLLILIEELIEAAKSNIEYKADKWLRNAVEEIEDYLKWKKL